MPVIPSDDEIEIHNLPEMVTLQSGMMVAVDSEDRGTKSFNLHSALEAKADRSEISNIETFTYTDSSVPAYGDISAAVSAGKTVLLTLGDAVSFQVHNNGPTYQLQKGTVYMLTMPASRPSVDSFIFVNTSKLGYSGEGGNDVAIVMTEITINDGGSVTKKVRFDSYVSGMGNWDDSLILWFTPFRGQSKQIYVNGKSHLLLPSSAASPLDSGQPHPIQGAQAICWGASNSDIGYVNLPMFSPVSGSQKFTAQPALLKVYHNDELSNAFTLVTEEKDNENVGGDIRLFDSSCLAAPWQPNHLYTAGKDIVWINGKVYICKTTHTSTSSVNLTNWEAKNWIQTLWDSTGMKVITCIFTDMTEPAVTDYLYADIMDWVNSGKGLSLNIRVDMDGSFVSMGIISSWVIQPEVPGQTGYLTGKMETVTGNYFVQIEKATDTVYPDYMKVTIRPEGS